MSKPIGAREQALRQAREAEAKSAGKPRTGTVSSKTLRETGSFLAKTNLDAEAAKAKPVTGPVCTETPPVPPAKTAPKRRVMPKIPKKQASAKKVDRSPLAVGTFVCRDGGCTMEQLVKRFGIEAHPMRTKIHAAKHELGFKIEYDRETKRYTGTAPKEKQ